MMLQAVYNFMNDAGISLVAGVPLALAAGMSIPFVRTAGFRLLPLAALPALLAVLFIVPGLEVQVAWFFMGGAMGLDASGRIFLGVTACVWLSAALAVVEKYRHDPLRFRFAGFFLASMCGNFGLILARDILGFYLFFALMSFSAYGLVVHNRTAGAVRAGRVYLMLVFLSELAMFTALVLLSPGGDVPAIGDVPTADYSALLILLLFIAFGVKLGALPLQSWMAPSYQEAPVPAATALAGAMVNAGIFGWLRFLPFGHAALPAGGAFFIILGASAALYGVLFGLYQERPGKVLASSSISQMGLATVIAGYGLLSEDGGKAALALLPLFTVHHSLAKTSLFLGYDLIARGGRPARAILLVGLLAPCLSLAGLPLASGAMVKGGIKELAALGDASWYLFAKIFLPVSSVGTTVLMLHCTRLLTQRTRSGRNGKKTVAAWLWVLSVGGVAAVPWLWPPLRGLADHSLQVSALVQSLWPVLLGTVLAAAWYKIGCRLPARGRAAADFDSLARAAHAGWLHALASLFDILAGVGRKTASATVRRPRFRNHIRRLGPGRWERALGRWPVVFLFYLLISIFLFMILLTGGLPPSGA